MTRNEIKALFPDATDEQITSLLNQYNTDILKEKNKAKDLKSSNDDAESKIKELEAQLADIENSKLSDIEKITKANETANNQIAELQKQIVSMEQKAKLAELGIVGDDASELIGADGKLNFELLGTIISNREKNAMAQKEKELLENTPNPLGNQAGGDSKDNVPADVANVKTISFGSTAVKDEVKNYYLR